MWELRSLGYRTDLFVCAFDGQVEDRGRYVVVRTPSNPLFWWGNFLLYPEAPDASAADSWQGDHARELPDIKTKLLTWDRPDGTTGEVEPFLRAGYEIDVSSLLTATSATLRRSSRHASDVEVVALDADAQWEGAKRALTNAFAVTTGGSMEDLRDFMDRQFARFRAMQERGHGQWDGAVVDGEIAASLGIVRERELGRFQLVGTDPKFARRGVCSTLVHEAGRRALAQGVSTLVMSADATYHAAKVYESVGFLPTERLVALLKRPPRA